MPRILIVENNEALALGLRNHLENEGYAVDVAPTGAEALRCMWRVPDLVLLDLSLPDVDGIALLAQLRAMAGAVPVAILSVRGAEADEVAGVSGPLGLPELLGRVRAVLRRTGLVRTRAMPAVVRFGTVEIRPERREVTRNGEPVPLRPKEWELLRALILRAGEIVPRGALLRQVWGYHPDVRSRTIDTHLGELRRKLEDDPAQPRHLLTIRRAGYRLVLD